MYENFFQLKKNPFRMTPDPELLFFTGAHREAFAGLTYAILSRKGFTVLTGDAGTGKTTLLTAILKSIPATRAHMCVLLNPTLTASEFLELILLQFGLPDVGPSKAQRLISLQRFLVESDRAGRIPVLIVDEAHMLSPEVLEEIRLLTNFESPEGKLLQIVLAGQSELNGTLNRNEMRQLKQRIAVRLNIKALNELEVQQYVKFRWAKSGAARELPFDDGTLSKIALASRGIPRVINAICDNALLLAYSNESYQVRTEHLYEVIRDLDLENGQRPAPAILREPPRPRAAAPAYDKLPPPRLQTAIPVSQGAADMRTLNRYAPPEPKPSFFARWAARDKPAGKR